MLIFGSGGRTVGLVCASNVGQIAAPIALCKLSAFGLLQCASMYHNVLRNETWPVSLALASTCFNRVHCWGFASALNRRPRWHFMRTLFSLRGPSSLFVSTSLPTSSPNHLTMNSMSESNLSHRPSSSDCFKLPLQWIKINAIWAPLQGYAPRFNKRISLRVLINWTTWSATQQIAPIALTSAQDRRHNTTWRPQRPPALYNFCIFTYK